MLDVEARRSPSTAPYASARRGESAAPGLLLAGLVAGATFVVALDGGGYALTSRHAIAVCLLWLLAVGVAFGFWPRGRVPVAAFLVGGLLAAFAAWTGLSILWSASAEKSFAELDRAVLYLALFAVVVVSSATPRALRGWLRGLGAGVAAVGILSLASRFFPEQFEGTSAVGLAQLFPETASRLNYPVEYWNALATLVALGVPCLLWAATAERRAVARAVALAPVPALAGVLYLTSSRGGIAVTALGAAVFLGLARSWRALAAVALAGAGSGLAAAVLLARDAVTAGPLAPGAVSEGRSAALLTAGICVGTGLLHGILSSRRLELGRRGRLAGVALGATAVAAVVAGIVLADPVERFERFKAVPTAEENATLQSHLASGSGNGRWQLWESAADQFAQRRLEGEGAGSYEAWWAENGTLAVFVRDAHSLYLETLGELGVVGLALLGGALVLGLAVGVRRTFAPDRELRLACAALTGAYVAWLVEAGIDWMWESTVVTLVAVACLALLVGPATEEEPKAARRGRVALGARIAVPLVALALVVAEGIPFVAQSEIGRSQEAVRAGDAETARDAAVAAQRFQSWAASPHLQRALVEELAGNLPAAHVAIERALELDRREWRLWLVDSRIETKLENFDEAELSLRRAVELNPRSSRFAGLPGAATG
jgi:O-antigen ligase